MVNDVNVEETFVILDHVIPKLNVLLLIIHHFLDVEVVLLVSQEMVHLVKM